ncbi:MAG: tail fiber protein [Bacteroidota bacterium]
MNKKTPTISESPLPLLVNVHGTVLNNETSNSIQIYLMNNSGDSIIFKGKASQGNQGGSLFSIAYFVDKGPVVSRPDALVPTDSHPKVSIKDFSMGSQYGEVVNDNVDKISINAIPEEDIILASNEFILITFENIITNFSARQANIYLTIDNVPDYVVSSFIAQVQISSIQTENQLIGIRTKPGGTNQQFSLSIAGNSDDFLEIQQPDVNKNRSLKEWVTQEIIDKFLPIGSIILWSGTEVPNGWAKCDGSTVAGIKTPDLTGRFVIGATAEYPLNQSGGSFLTTLKKENLPAHTHQASTSGLPVYEGGDKGNYKLMTKDAYNYFLLSLSNSSPPKNEDQDFVTAAHDMKSDEKRKVYSRASFDRGSHDDKPQKLVDCFKHSHKITVHPTGDGQPFKHAPPYCSLHYIMRVQEV